MAKRRTRRRPPRLRLIPFFADLSPNDPALRKADRMMSLKQTRSPHRDTEPEESMPAKVGATTLEKLNATAGDPSNKDVKNRIRAWQEAGGVNKPVEHNVITVERSRSRSPVKKEGVKEVEIRNTSPNKWPGKKEYVAIVDEGTGKVQGVKVISPKKSPVSPAEPSPRFGPVTFDPEKKAWVRHKTSKPAVDMDEVMHAGMPKKRVVSDGHWRKDRSPGKKPAPAKEDVAEEEPKRKITVQKSTPNLRSRHVPQKSMPEIKLRPTPTRQSSTEPRPYMTREPVRERSTWRTWDPTEDSAMRARKNRKASRSRSRSRERDGPTSSIHVERPTAPKGLSPKIAYTPYSPKKSDARKPSNRKSFESEETSPTIEPVSSGKRRHRQRRRSTPPTSDVETEQISLASPAPDDSISRQGLPTKPAPLRISKSPRIPQTTEAASPKLAGVPVPASQPKPSGNRVETWLGETADPFVDGLSRASSEVKDRKPSYKVLRRRESATNNKQPSKVEEFSSGASPKHSPSDKENKPKKRSVSKPVVIVEDETDVSSATTATEVPPPRKEPAGKFSIPRKKIPTLGRPLSTIASVATHDVKDEPAAPSIVFEESTSEVNTGPGVQKHKSGLKRRLTKHEDLMSVLSIPTGEAPSLVSARSLRTRRTPLDSATMENVLVELASDESKYQRELRTLVDGVIPVLLSNVLSKSNSAVTANLFGPAHKTAAAVTQPIVNMGIALERLKANHKRMPQTDPDALVKWAQTASKVYSDYLKAWRMGFDDVIVTLAPPDPAEKKDGWDHDLPRNDKGDLVDGDGERVDVAYLLKRPLVRLKYLAKTFRSINHVKPSPDAEAMADQYQALVVEARKKSNDERARLEDEAAAAIDPTRARDLKTLALLAGVKIDAGRCVRARDYFDMTLRHSTGQRLDCRIELIIRDNDAEANTGGDVLICEVSDTGRWLLFPPMLQSMVSARLTSVLGAMITMVRGLNADGSEWSELLTLQSEEGQACEEWAHMLGEGPTPPSPTKTDFTYPTTETAQTPSTEKFEMTDYTFTATTTTDQERSPRLLSPRSEKPNVSFKSRSPSPTEIEVPIGEQARKTSKRWSYNVGAVALDLLGQATPTFARKSRPDTRDDTKRPMSMPPESPCPRSPTQQFNHAHAFTDKAAAADAQRAGSPIRRSKATKHRRTPSTHGSDRSSYTPERGMSPERKDPGRPILQRSQPTYASSQTSLTSASRTDYSVWMPSTSSVLSDEDDSQYDDDDDQTIVSERPEMDRKTSSVPSQDPPLVNKLRKNSPPQTPTQSRRHESEPPPDIERDVPSSAPAKLQRRMTSAEKKHEEKPKAAETPSKLKMSFLPSLTPNFLKRNRRPSSPLKHEYAPSPLESDSDSEIDGSDMDDDDDSSFTSEDSQDESDHFSQVKSPGLNSITKSPFETVKSPTASLKSPTARSIKSPTLEEARATPPESVASLTSQTLEPSNSASQVPFRHVPQVSSKASKTVANIFAWANTMQGGWEDLHSQEIRVVVTPGLIEAFDMAEAHSVPNVDSEGNECSPSIHGVAPLIALELTPLVPLRRGTALDISIRSPPTDNSQIKSSNNVMFRSRSPEECEALYNLINQARINNPTYIALQNARGPFGEETWAAAMERRANQRSSSASSWWGIGRRGSYRANSTRQRPASFAASESSVGTMNSAFSALRRFSHGSADSPTTKRRFSISRSTLTSRNSIKSSNDDTLSSGYSTPVPAGLGISGLSPNPGADGNASLGINGVKIRLYARESASKWRDMGSARLTIQLPSRPPTAPGQPAPVLPSLTRRKRVLVQGTTKGETLLDVTVGETSFERVARTGIAISVFEDDARWGVGQRGGVTGGVRGVFMVQMKSERDAAYTFGLVGGSRY
ncbi:hypothetical protein MBLNU457_3612t3 [Dothideomycetes sp. NU457]